ncbi:MAG: tRNA (adenosine(37)-N6)-threonylcarbamoyltransferase complex ATPase subunit type 1 TsaE [Pseudomonadota bacterium]
MLAAMAPDPFATTTSPSADATADLATRLAKSLGPGDTLGLSGPLGAGKSHFARAIIASLSGAREIPSPTYTLVQTYDGPGFDIWHADLYRLTEPEELAELGLEEAFGTALCLIEWPDRLPETPRRALDISLLPVQGKEDSRRIAFCGALDLWQDRVKAALAKKCAPIA